jgi:hypothetical protein
MILALIIMWELSLVLGLAMGGVALVIAIKGRNDLPKGAVYGTYALAVVGVLMLIGYMAA